MQLTEHFADTELRVAGADAQIVANATALCAAILEPIRAKFGPVTITSGYRSPTGNEAAGGVTNSQHLYEGGNAAADIRVQPMVIIFDWITQQSELPFDQAILETDETDTPRCIHLSYVNGGTQRREALTGGVNGTKPYLPAPVS